jgi:hypothetical protein
VESALGITAIEAAIAGLGTASAEDIGTGSGQIPILGAGGLPAVSGENLTGVLKSLPYGRYIESTASGVNAQGGGTPTYVAASDQWVTRVINSTATALSGASLSTNAITLPAGTYLIEFSVPWYTEGFSQARVWQTSGTPQEWYRTPTQKGAGWRLHTGSVSVTLASTQTFVIQTADTANSTGGNPFGEGGTGVINPNIFTDVRIWRVSP